MYFNGCGNAWVPSYRAISLPRSNFEFLLTTPGPEALTFLIKNKEKISHLKTLKGGGTLVWFK